jgi:beta-lactamase class A
MALALDKIFTDAGCDGTLHVREVHGVGEIGLEPDRPVVAASVIKVPIGLELFCLAEMGDVDLHTQIQISEAERRPGPTGISNFNDDVTLSLGDLAYLMLTISDNTATETVLNTIGLARINDRLRALSLTGTVMENTVQELLDSVGRDMGFRDWTELERALKGELGPEAKSRGSSTERFLACAALDPLRATRTTPREMTTLLSVIWRDEAASVTVCSRLRRIMADQLTRERLASGFPHGVLVSAKSGSLFGVVRNEIGVVEFPDGKQYAIGVFTRAHAPYVGAAQINSAIGRAAFAAVEHLRRGS